MFNWFRRSKKHRSRGPRRRMRIACRTATRGQTAQGQDQPSPRDGPPDRSGGFDGNQDFVTRYGDPFDD